jgi:hypothetical protein
MECLLRPLWRGRAPHSDANDAIIAVPIEMFVQASEQICGRSVEPGRPGDRDGHQAQRRPATLLRNRCRELQHFLSRRQIVVGRQGDVVAEEERVSIRHLADERLDETVVGVEAAGEDDRQEVHRGLATVRAEIGTGPK